MQFWYYKCNDIDYCIKANTSEKAYKMLKKYNIPVTGTIKNATNVVAEGAKIMCIGCCVSYKDDGIWQPIGRRFLNL